MPDQPLRHDFVDEFPPGPNDLPAEEYNRHAQRTDAAYDAAIAAGTAATLVTNRVANALTAAIPTLWITSADGVSEPVDKVNYVTCTLKFSDGTTYPARFRGRGNSTWLLPKKPWKVKLDTKTGPLGLPASKDFCLLANFYDSSLLRNSIYFKLSALLPGFLFTPQGKQVRVYVNGEYRGVYWFGQDVRIEEFRLPGSAAAKTGIGLTGGYSMEIDRRAAGPMGDKPFFITTENVVVAMDEPDSADERLAYITAWIQDFEDRLMGDDWLDPVLGYAGKVNMASFATWYLVNELIANVDADFFSSVKIFKARDTATVPGRLYMGAPWDGDNSIQTWIALPYELLVATRENRHGETYPGAIWVKRMLNDPAFRDVLKAQWPTLRDFVKNGGMDAWLRKESRNLSDSRVSDSWIWTNSAPKFTDPFYRQTLMSYLQQRCNLIESSLYRGTGSVDWEVLTSDSFTNPGTGFMVGRYTDAAIGGDPMPWEVGTQENIWTIQPDEWLGWDSPLAGNPQQIGFQVDGPMEVEFDKAPHGIGGVRVALGADSMTAEAALGAAVMFFSFGVAASYPPVSFYQDIDARPTWATETHRIKLRLLNETFSMWVDDVLTWQVDTVLRMGDWLFFEKDPLTRAGGSIIDNVVVRYLPIVLGSIPEWAAATSDTFSGPGGSIVGRTSDAVLGGQPVLWAVSNSNSGWVYENKKLGFSGNGQQQVFGTEVEGPVQVKFTLVDVPAANNSLVLHLGTASLTSEQGMTVTITNQGMDVTYTSSEGPELIHVDIPVSGWDGTAWRIERVNSYFNVFIAGVPVVQIATAPDPAGQWVTFRKNGNDVAPQYVLRDLQIRRKPVEARNRAQSPSLELYDWGWGGYGGTFSRVPEAAHLGNYGWQAVFSGGPGAMSNFSHAPDGEDFGGLTTDGSIWLRAVGHSTPVVLEVKPVMADYTYPGPNKATAPIPLVDGEWKQITIPSALLPAGTAHVEVSVFRGDGQQWEAGQILNGDDIDIRVW